MAKSRRNAGGATRGRFKPKKMGKGWATHRKTRGETRPCVILTKNADGTPVVNVHHEEETEVQVPQASTEDGKPVEVTVEA